MHVRSHPPQNEEEHYYGAGEYKLSQLDGYSNSHLLHFAEEYERKRTDGGSYLRT